MPAGSIYVRRFERRDLRRVVDIERASFGKDAWKPELFLAYARAYPELFLIARLGRRISGYSITRTDWRGAELESIAVDPPYRGRGVAEALLKKTLAISRPGTMRLMVGVENEPALRFYERFGFTRVRKIPAYYGPGRDAWRMRVSAYRTATVREPVAYRTATVREPVPQGPFQHRAKAKTEDK